MTQDTIEMDTSMLGRVAALLIRDLGRRRVIFLALARGQDIDCTHLLICVGTECLAMSCV
jgi:hypothetical protein